MTRRQLFKSILSVPIVAITGKLLPQDAPMATDHVYVYRAANTGYKGKVYHGNVISVTEQAFIDIQDADRRVQANTGISNIWFG